MLRRFCLALTAAALLPPVALAGDQATTTRIETRPFYGATVTIEAGVRVFRPLPPHSRVIINPGGKTPLSLVFEERPAVNGNGSGPADGDMRSDAGPNGHAGYYAGGVPITDGFHGGHARRGPHGYYPAALDRRPRGHRLQHPAAHPAAAPVRPASGRGGRH